MNDEFDTGRRAPPRWGKSGMRYAARQVPDDRQVRKNGRWRRVSDETDEVTYNERRKEPKGFRNGARVNR